MSYRVERRVETQSKRPFFVVTGPGATPYISARDEEHADYLASWLNVAYARGKQAATKEHKAKMRRLGACI